MKVIAPDHVTGPIRGGQRLGRVEVSQGGEVVATVPLIAGAALPAATSRSAPSAGRGVLGC